MTAYPRVQKKNRRAEKHERMKLFEKASKVLEFDRITDALASLASTGGGAEKLRAAVPATDEAGDRKSTRLNSSHNA